MVDFWWRFEDHVCAQCLGRIVSRVAEDGQRIMQCSNCGAEGVGDPPVICACGIRRGKFDRLRCVRLEHRIEGVAAEVVVSEVDDVR